MAEMDDIRFGVHDFASLFSDEEMITILLLKVQLSNTRHEEDVILEPCSKREKGQYDNYGWITYSYFYLHFLVNHDLWVLIPFNDYKCYPFSMSGV